jgi:HEAT repeat protein/beta-lactamase regulating signal transducer with metallopeptidase domain
MTNLSLPLVIDAVVKASVVLGAAALAAAALRRASASARHFVWTLGLLSALAAPALSLALPRWELPLVTVPAAAPAAGSDQAPVMEMTRRIAPPRGDERTSSPANHVSAVNSAASDAVVNGVTLPSWPVIALAIWALGASAILARLAIGLLAVQWMSRRTPEIASAPWLAQARSLASELGLSRVRFLRGAAGTMPMAWGIVRQSVLVPADADEWPAHRVRVVLLHELAHVKRRDCLTHLVAQLACAAYWFNPLVWMAVRRLRTERERACDDLVLAAGTRGSDYADQLLDIARVMQAGRFPAVFAGASLAMAQRSQLEGRLIAILDPSVPRRGLTRARAAFGAAIFTALMLAVASVQPWAEERGAAVAAEMGDAMAAQSAATAERPVEQTAVAQKAQDAAQDRVQGAIKGGIEGGIHGGVRGGLAGGVAEGVVSSVAGSVAGGVVGGVVSGVASAVTHGVADALAQAGSEIEHEVEKEQEQEKDAKGRRDPRMVSALMEALKDSDKDVRETAMHALVQMRDPRIFDPLVTALKDASADVREQAAFGLGQLRDARAITPLAAALKDVDADVREQVVFALGQLRAAGAADALAQALRDASPSVREQAAFALGQIRDKKAIEPLTSALKDENASVREQAAFALGQLRASGAIEALVVALKDSNPGVREQVAFALGQIGDPRAIDGLMTALKDVNASVRQQAAFALGQIRY